MTPDFQRQRNDRDEIWWRLNLYCRAVDRRDYPLIREVFWPDAVIDSGPLLGTPEDFIVSRSSDPKPPAHSQHHLTTHLCEVDGDVAFAETYWIFRGGEPGASPAVGTGRYLDRFERRDGAWKIAFRYSLMDLPGETMAIAPAPAEDNPMFANGVTARGPADPSYRRPWVNIRPNP